MVLLLGRIWTDITKEYQGHDLVAGNGKPLFAGKLHKVAKSHRVTMSAVTQWQKSLISAKGLVTMPCKIIK